MNINARPVIIDSYKTRGQTSMKFSKNRHIIDYRLKASNTSVFLPPKSHFNLIRNHISINDSVWNSSVYFKTGKNCVLEPDPDVIADDFLHSI